MEIKETLRDEAPVTEPAKTEGVLELFCDGVFLLRCEKLCTLL